VNWDKAYGYINGLFMGLQKKESWEPLKWFLCFGSLLHVSRMTMGHIKKMPDDQDIDVGILYEDYEPHQLENKMFALGLQIKRKIIHDVDKKPLYYSLQGVGTGINICLFCWYKHGNIRYHTYDVLREKRDKPSKYIFKGIPAECLECSTQEMPIPGLYRTVKVPTRYGTLFDHWYPDWLTKRKHISTTRWQIEMKSCRKFEDDSFEKVPVKCPVTGKVWLNGQETHE
jgi:hypothetical protein